MGIIPWKRPTTAFGYAQAIDSTWARYQREADEAGHEHCCCGQVHFVGTRAEELLKAYLDDRSAQGLDAEVGGYSFHVQQVEPPWGGSVPVAYAVPTIPKPH